MKEAELKIKVASITESQGNKVMAVVHLLMYNSCTSVSY